MDEEHKEQEAVAEIGGTLQSLASPRTSQTAANVDNRMDEVPADKFGSAHRQRPSLTRV